MSSSFLAPGSITQDFLMAFSAAGLAIPSVIVQFPDHRQRQAGGGRKVGRRLDIRSRQDPNKKYDVEITPLSDQKLKVMGYEA